MPQILLDGIGAPVLCTQPRRLAVVAVATHVAKQRNVTLGGEEVGYHVGQQNFSTKSTKLLFATAGILLEELKCNGLEALAKYKCVVIDECHERSPESDLCLSIIKSFMKVHLRARIHIVLMSATFDHGRYRSFFADVPGCEDIDTVTLETVQSITAFHQQVQTSYLDDIVKDFGLTTMVQFQRKMRSDPDAELAGGDGGKSLSSDLLQLIVLMVAHLNVREPREAVFLIFAPTYNQLEQCFDCLQCAFPGELILSVLHSSVAIEDCLQSMKFSNSSTTQTPKRKVLLASAIADSSVTIPYVTCVIDTCRSLLVRWDSSTQSYLTKTVWASKSTCDQRQGRTGRTCPGKVFRLVNKGFYIKRLESWDQPQLLLSSCQNEVLLLLSSENRVMSDPVGLLQRCMDPPPNTTITQAVNHLKSIGACQEIIQGRKIKLIPTEYGKLLSSLPFVVSDSSIILRAAQHAYLHEALTLWTIKSIRPYPITHYFGDSNKNREALEMYKSNVDHKDPKSVALANLSAFMFWDVVWNNGRRIVAKERFHRCTSSEIGSISPRDQGLFGEADFFTTNHIEGSDREKADCGVWKWTQQAEETHLAWCKEHRINPTSVRAISETLDATINLLFHSKNEPEWLRCTHAEPRWRRPNDWEGRKDETEMLRLVYGEHHSEIVSTTLSSLWDGTFKSASSTDSVLEGRRRILMNENSASAVCVHFLKGSCMYGSKCRNLHSLAVRPHCRFFAFGSCSKGEDCIFLHDDNSRQASSSENDHSVGMILNNDPLGAIAPVLSDLQLTDGALGWYMKQGPKLIMLGDGNFAFSQSLAMLEFPAYASTTIEHSHHTYHGNYFTGVDATRVHTDSLLSTIVQSGIIDSCAWNFPFTGVNEDEEGHLDLLSGTFLSLSLLFSSKLLKKQHGTIQFGLALQGDQFSRWSVLRSARRSGWTLTSWCHFDHLAFPGYTPSRTTGQPFPVENARFYVFQLMAH